MTSVDRTAYPRFPRVVSGRELAEAFTPSDGEADWARGRTQDAGHLLASVVAGVEANTFPVCTSSAASRARAPWRTYSCSTRTGLPGAAGAVGWQRPRAWMEGLASPTGSGRPAVAACPGRTPGKGPGSRSPWLRSPDRGGDPGPVLSGQDRYPAPASCRCHDGPPSSVLHAHAAQTSALISSHLFLDHAQGSVSVRDPQPDIRTVGHAATATCEGTVSYDLSGERLTERGLSGRPHPAPCRRRRRACLSDLHVPVGWAAPHPQAG